MRKNAPLILIIALLVIAYGISQYWNEQRSSTFEAVLLDFLAEDIQRIDIQKETEPAYRILRSEGRWLMSKQHLHEVVDSEAVEELLQRLRSIRTAEIVADQRKAWPDYGVADQQGVKICLHQKAPSPLCVRIGNYAYSAEDRRLEAYTRMEGQREVYAINGLSVSILDGDANFFREHQLTQLEQPIERITWRQSDQQYSVIVDSLGEAPTLLTDSLTWCNYAQQLQHFKGAYFADDIDETRLKEQLDWQIILHTSIDSLLVSCYQDSTRLKPFILHSQQFPNRWFSSDSSGIYQQLLQPWQKMISTHE